VDLTLLPGRKSGKPDSGDGCFGDDAQTSIFSNNGRLLVEGERRRYCRHRLEWELGIWLGVVRYGSGRATFTAEIYRKYEVTCGSSLDDFAKIILDCTVLYMSKIIFKHCIHLQLDG